MTPMTEEQIDALRLQAFDTNSEADRAAYFEAVNQWFQDRHYRQIAHSEIERLTAENARLREALREIAGARPRCCEISDAMQYIARAALAEKGER